MAYSTTYEIVYSSNRRNLITSEQFADFGYPDGYEAAAVKVIQKDGRLISKDMIIENTNWVDVEAPGYCKLALKKRKGLR